MTTKLFRSTVRTRVLFALVATLFGISVFIHQMYFAGKVQAVSSTVVISQVYGGGGNVGSSIKNDFIEIFNKGNTPVNLAGWTVQYASAGGTAWSGSTALNGTLQPGQYYLIQEAAGAAGTVNLPTPDATGNIAMGAGSGKVALVNSSSILTGTGCPFGPTVVDFVGYGTGAGGANCFETAQAPTPSSTVADKRAGNGCTDTDNNSTDFATGAPTPRNTATPTNPCVGATNPSGVGAANPSSVAPSGTTLLTVTVTPGTNPTSTAHTVNANLTAIGGSATQQFFDDGSNGDSTPADNVFSFNATVANGTSGGSKSLPFTITETAPQTRTGSGSISLTVLAPSNPSGAGASNPVSVLPGEISTLTVTVTPGTNPTSTGLVVVADLTAIGGSASQMFFDDGASGGDVTAGNNVFTFTATVDSATTSGAKLLPFTISDSQGRSGSGNISLTVQQPPPPVDHMVISQLYGGGGNTGATFTNDYVELYNPTGVPFNLAGWSLQYASAGGTSWTNKQPLGGMVAPGEYFLVGLASGGGNGSPLPVTPNIQGDINMSATTGKIALVSNSVTLTGSCPNGLDPDIVDFVGYGTSASCFEGATRAPAPSNTTSIFRKVNGAQDTNQNGTDFQTGTPNPRRTAPIAELGPWVADTEPIADGNNAPYDSTITVDFSEPVDVTGNWYDITCTLSGQHTSATVASYNGFKGYHITPNTGFNFGDQCTVTVFHANVHDQDLNDSDPGTDTLFADYSWSFTVVSAGATPYPSTVHLTMGNPSNALADLLQPNNYLMEKPSFALSYNRDKGTPNWVSWHLETVWTGNLTRVDTFRADPAVPPDWYRVQSTDYFASGFDRGHMTPNADRDNPASIPLNQETFLMSNMVPQAPNNNQGPWADLEGFLRTLLNDNEIYVVSGPFGIGGSGDNGPMSTIAGGHVTVPAQTWKVALVLPKGDNDISRVTAAARTIAVIMPNQNSINSDWHTYLTTVDAVENLTGYDFFANVPDAIENAIEAGTNGVNPPGTEGQSVTTNEDTSRSITLTAVSPLTNPTFTFTIVTPPAHGNLVGTGSDPSYEPNPDFHGPDSFTFRVNDGSFDSNVSTVNITVTEVNDSPVANDDTGSTNEDTTLNLSVADLSDNDSTGPSNESLQSLTVTNVTTTAETHGTVSLMNGIVTYSPAQDYNGLASFTYQVCDDGTTSGAPDSKCSTGVVNITVNAVNDQPAANSQSKSTNGNTPVSISLTGSDLETSTANLIFTVTSGPTHGSLSGTAPNLTYTPALNYSGPDSFKFTVKDSGDDTSAALTSAEATVAITVNDTIAPTITPPSNVTAFTGASATACSAFVSDGTLGSASASDNAGSVSVSRTGVPAGNIFPVGTTTITYTATDGVGNTTTATQAVTVIDNTSPTITLSGNPMSLWAPNHEYHTVKVSDLVAAASDNCDASVNLSKVVISQVTSDEGENGGGSGNTINDIVIAPDGKSVQLRAERETSGNGRVYTITFLVTDAAGNSGTATAAVVVPKNQNGQSAVDSGARYIVVRKKP